MRCNEMRCNEMRCNEMRCNEMRLNGSTPFQHPFKVPSTPFEILFDKNQKIYTKF